MKKKLVAVVLAIALVFSVTCVGAYADSPNSCRQRLSPVQQIAFLAAECAVDSCNRLVEIAVRRAQATPYNDVIPMLVTVNALIKEATIIANTLGFEVECCYTEYVVDGQTVLIDPLRVINPLPPKPQ